MGVALMNGLSRVFRIEEYIPTLVVEDFFEGAIMSSCVPDLKTKISDCTVVVGESSLYILSGDAWNFEIDRLDKGEVCNFVICTEMDYIIIEYVRNKVEQSYVIDSVRCSGGKGLHTLYRMLNEQFLGE